MYITKTPLKWAMGVCSVKVFEVEDAEGPLEGTQAGDISASFGRLRLADAAAVGLPQRHLQDLAAEQERLAARPGPSSVEIDAAAAMGVPDLARAEGGGAASAGEPELARDDYGAEPQQLGLEADLQLWRQHLGIPEPQGQRSSYQAVFKHGCQVFSCCQSFCCIMRRLSASHYASTPDAFMHYANESGYQMQLGMVHECAIVCVNRRSNATADGRRPEAGVRRSAGRCRWPRRA